jgi:hypothetical protein
MKFRYALFRGPGSIRRALKDAAALGAIVWLVFVLTVAYDLVAR